MPRLGRLTARQVNLLLELLVVLAILTGLTSWAVGTRWDRILTVAHGGIGVALLVVAPLKMRGSVRAGMRRRRPTRWVSVLFGSLVLATVGLGVLHATGLWYGVGYWSALWTHELFAFVLIPLFLWHIVSRPVRPKLVDVDRRALLRGGVILGAAGALYSTQELVVRLAGLAGGRRRFTGSHEIASFDPTHMPTVQWIDDSAPHADAEQWRLDVDGRPVSIDELRAQARPVVAALDCTGGWWSEQSWDAVPLSALIPAPSGRSVKVTSSTGYDRRYPLASLDNLYLAVGYGGQPLRRGHGAPVRLVAPGRRGPWWVKWVVSVELDDRPDWLQFPFPLS